MVALAIAFCFFASSFCITLVLATFVSILFDPAVTFFERFRIPRSLSAALLISGALIGLGFLAYGSYNRFSNFVEDFPAYATRLRSITEPLNHKIAKVEESAGRLDPEPTKRITEVKVKQPPTWPSYILRGFGSVSGVIVILGVVPFLVFFMLINKHKWYRAMEQILGPRIDAITFSNRLEDMVRRFALGNLLVGLLMAAATLCLLFALDIRSAIILGFVSGFLNLIPFLGFLLAGFVPVAAAFIQGSSWTSIVTIALTVSTLHLLVSNLVIPRFVGKRINIGPVAATAGILFWGWLWGVMGVLLAIPLTGVAKLIADCHPSLKPLSNVLAEDPAIDKQTDNDVRDLVLTNSVRSQVSEEI